MPSRRTILKSAALAEQFLAVLKSQDDAHLREVQLAHRKDSYVARGNLFDVANLCCSEVSDPTTIKVSGADTAEGNSLAVSKATTSPGNGPGLHKHASQDEWWYVLEGEFVFQVGEQKFRANAGASVSVHALFRTPS